MERWISDTNDFLHSYINFGGRNGTYDGRLHTETAKLRTAKDVQKLGR